ncbi:uncharacterized protein F4812DRAFT_464659 [Daldinia caldariorum]|uniref:uncharacterized protein n=1 Tax=Daldinia caldariorum TaxID=326644 RepID=UPI002008A9DD|nr:uncharacterized protein F4812DRAFT_464659 [Daldinia caldariorum]KAI1472542.1 hypothetical protein F4812DRAFT_464659 [Daldinia caldariorum]
MSFYEKFKAVTRGWTITSNYSRLSEETLLSSPDCEKQNIESIPHSKKRSFLGAIWAVLFVIWTIAVFLVASRFHGRAACIRETTTWSPAIDVVRYKDVIIEGDFLKKSPYRGAGESVDRAWDELWMVGGVPIRIDDSELAILNKSAERPWTRIPESRGGGIAGYPEVFHQLHCLNMLRMASYPELYATHSLFADHPPDTTRSHIDHCIEIIRMQLQCSAEMTPVLTEDIPGRKFPAADFRVTHRCKNFDELFTWTKENILHGAGNWDIPRFGDH